MLTRDEKIAVAMLMGEATSPCGGCQGTGKQFTPWSHAPCRLCLSTGRFLGHKVIERIKEIENGQCDALPAKGTRG